MPQLPREAQWLLCFYCREDVEEVEWMSNWAKSRHYKVHQCGCGHDAWGRVDFLGSGHDRFRREPEKLESMLKPYAGMSNDFPRIPFPLQKL